MAKHVVVGGPISTGDKLYLADQEIDLNPENAEQLLALGEVLTVADYKAMKKAEKEAAAGEQE